MHPTGMHSCLFCGGSNGDTRLAHSLPIHFFSSSCSFQEKKDQNNRFVPLLNLLLLLLPPANESLGQGNIFRSVCQEFCPWGGAILACTAGGIPTYLAAGLQGVSQHALQVFRATPKGKFRGIWLGGGFQAHCAGLNPLSSTI